MIHCQPQAIDSPHRLCIVHTIHMRYVFFYLSLCPCHCMSLVREFLSRVFRQLMGLPHFLLSFSSQLTQSTSPTKYLFATYSECCAVLLHLLYVWQLLCIIVYLFFFYERKKGRTNSLCHERLTNTPPHFNFPVFAVLRIYRHSHLSYIYIIDRHVLLNRIYISFRCLVRLHTFFLIILLYYKSKVNKLLTKTLFCYIILQLLYQEKFNTVTLLPLLSLNS